MKRAILVVLLGMTVFAEEPRVSRATIMAAEVAMDHRFEKLFPDNPFMLLGNARGVYLDGYGAVFSAEVNLVAAAGGPFRGKVTHEEALRHRDEKLKRVPVLRTSMKQALIGAAQSLDTVPLDERVVLAVSLFRHSWEEMNGVPQQIVVSAQRRTLVQLQTANASPDVVQATIQVREY
jgi:hypothetical protein